MYLALEVLLCIKKRVPSNHLFQLFFKLQLFRDHLDGPERLSECELPGKEAFYDRMSATDITETQYANACKVWNSMPTKTLREYMYLKTYLLADVLQVSDAITAFRHTLMKDLRPDPLQNLVVLHGTGR